jgi:redox-sensing transcriptional repressor
VPDRWPPKPVVTLCELVNTQLGLLWFAAVDHGENSNGNGAGVEPRPIPVASVARLPVYLRALYELMAEGVTNVSSERLAEVAGVNAAKLRKDLSYLGSYGTRGVGYDVEYLLYQMNRELGLTKQWPIIIVGAGNLGTALANYRGFDERGYPVLGIVDIDPAKIGLQAHGVRISHIDGLADIIPEEGRVIGVIATPPGAAQDAADRLVRAGVRSILNFAPVVLVVPADVSVRKVDLAVELQILSFYQQRSFQEPAEPPSASVTHDAGPRVTTKTPVVGA